MKVKIKSFNGELPHYLTLGKEYDLYEDGSLPPHLICDEGKKVYIIINECFHLNGGSWEIVK